MKLFQVPHFIAFLICLAFGRTAGGYIAQAEMNTVRTSNSQSVQMEKITHFNNQHNFLVINVDNLEKEIPTLEVVWWLLHKERVPFNMIPLYPSLIEPLKGQPIAQSFKLIRDRRNVRLASEFEAAIHAQGIIWDSYIILDNWALSKLTNINNPNLSQNSLPSSPHGTELGGDQLIVRSLTHQWQEICRDILQIDWLDPTRQEMLQDLLHSHIILGPDIPIAAAAWQQILSQNQTLRCVFPTSDPQINK